MADGAKRQCAVLLPHDKSTSLPTHDGCKDTMDRNGKIPQHLASRRRHTLTVGASFFGEWDEKGLGGLDCLCDTTWRLLYLESYEVLKFWAANKYQYNFLMCVCCLLLFLLLSFAFPSSKWVLTTKAQGDRQPGHLGGFLSNTQPTPSLPGH